MPPNIADLLSQQGYGIPLLNDLGDQTPSGFVTPQLAETGGFPIGTGLQEQSLSDILGQARPQPNQVLTAPVAGVKRMAGGGANLQQGAGIAAAGMMVPPIDTEGDSGFMDMPLGQRILFSLSPPGVQQAILKKRELQRKTAAAQIKGEVEAGLNQFLLKGNTAGATQFVDETVSKQQFMPELLQSVPKWYEAIRNKHYSVQRGRAIYLALASKVVDPVSGGTYTYKQGLDPAYKALYDDWTALIAQNPNADIGEVFGGLSDETQAKFFSDIFGLQRQPTEAVGGIVPTSPISGGYAQQTEPFKYFERTSMFQNEVVQDFLQRRKILTSDFVNGLNNRDPQMMGLLDDIANAGADYRGIVSQWHNYGPFIEDATGYTLNDLLSMNPNVAGKLTNQFEPGGKFNLQGDLPRGKPGPGQTINRALQGAAGQQGDIAFQQQTAKEDADQLKAIQTGLPFLNKAYDAVTQMEQQMGGRFFEMLKGLGVKGWIEISADLTNLMRQAHNYTPTREERMFVQNMAFLTEQVDNILKSPSRMAETIRARLDVTRTANMNDVADQLFLLRDSLLTLQTGINARRTQAPSRTQRSTTPEAPIDRRGTATPSKGNPPGKGTTSPSTPKPLTTPPNLSQPLPPVRPGFGPQPVNPPSGQGFVPTNPQAEKKFKRQLLEEEMKRRLQQLRDQVFKPQQQQPAPVVPPQLPPQPPPQFPFPQGGPRP